MSTIIDETSSSNKWIKFEASGQRGLSLNHHVQINKISMLSQKSNMPRHRVGRKWSALLWDPRSVESPGVELGGSVNGFAA
jgi:hypothetical protein